MSPPGVPRDNMKVVTGFEGPSALRSPEMRGPSAVLRPVETSMRHSDGLFQSCDVMRRVGPTDYHPLAAFLVPDLDQRRQESGRHLMEKRAHNPDLAGPRAAG